MADIKTRDVTRGTIKSLDRAASSMHRMKEQAIRSKSIEIGGQKDSDSVSAYAQDLTEHYAGSSAVYAAEAGAKLAIRSRQKPPKIAEVSPDNEERIQQAFKEQGVKMICDGQWNQLLNCKTDAEADSLATRLVGVPCKVIRNGGDAIPIGKLKQGDIISLYNSSGYYHTMFYEGNGKAADCTSGRSDNIQAGNTLSQSTKSKIKVAIRYGG